MKTIRACLSALLGERCGAYFDQAVVRVGGCQSDCTGLLILLPPASLSLFPEEDAG